MKFTKSALEKVACPPGKKEFYAWDDTLAGFGLRAYPSGKRVWVCYYRTDNKTQRRETLGDFRVLDLDEARDRARRLLTKVADGIDPVAEREAAEKAKVEAAAERLRRLTVGQLVEKYVATHVPNLAVRWRGMVVRQLRVNAKPLHDMVAEDVAPKHVAGLLNEVAASATPGVANQVRANLSSMWAWGIKRGLLEMAANPVINTAKPLDKPQSRDRVLSDAEVALIWRCTSELGTYDRIVRLLLLTACRRNEIGEGRWREVTLEADKQAGMWLLPAARSKNKLPHEIMLSALAVEQLPERGETDAPIFAVKTRGKAPKDQSKGKPATQPFSAWSDSKATLDSRINDAMLKDFVELHGREPHDGEVHVIPWTLHDFRRTFSTWANEGGILPHEVEAVLNHVSGTARKGVAGVYNKAAYRSQKRAALLAWERHIRRLVGLEVPKDNVVPLANRG
jgi:integrase